MGHREKKGELEGTSYKLSLNFLDNRDKLPCRPRGAAVRTERVRACEELGQTASRANAEEVLVQCHCRHHHYGLRFYKSRLNTTIPSGAVCKRNLLLTEHQPGRCQPHTWHSTHLHLILSNLHPSLVCSGGRTVTSGSDLDSGTHTSTQQLYNPGTVP